MGVVYPHIDIKELEEAVYATIEDSQNTVLVPMLYARKLNSEGSEYDEVPAPMLFEGLGDFVSTMRSGAGIDSATLRNIGIGGRGTLDKGYITAYTLLNANLPVLIVPVTFDQLNAGSESEVHWESDQYWCTEEYAFSLIDNAIFEEALFERYNLYSRALYDIRFITSGGYPNIGLINGDNVYARAQNNMLSLAISRGDCVALLDVSSYIDDKTKLKAFATGGLVSNGEYGTMFAPWCRFNLNALGDAYSDYKMPGSLAYLLAYANSIANNASWLAVSGIVRGVIPNLIAPIFNINESFMEDLQGKETTVTRRVNPIMNAGVYGYRIWGNRVFKPSDTTGTTKLKYQDFLNVRMLLCLIKKQLYTAALRTTFEPNDAIVWVNFKSLVNDLLEKMRSGRGISWYRWKRLPADNRATIKAKLYVKPIEAVEVFDITVELTDDDTIVEEG